MLMDANSGPSLQVVVLVSAWELAWGLASVSGLVSVLAQDSR